VAYATRILIPATSAGIAARNFAMRLMPLAAAAQRVSARKPAILAETVFRHRKSE
jgi:hypothetical protein